MYASLAAGVAQWWSNAFVKQRLRVQVPPPAESLFIERIPIPRKGAS